MPVPPTDRGVGTGDNSPAPNPTRVWNSTSRESTLTISAKLQRYARRVVKKFDRNGSGALEASEWALLPGDPRKIDRNGDGVITVDELAEYLAKYAVASAANRGDRMAALAAAAGGDFPARHAR